MANKETKRLGNKGFSLVELIVVIAIMAVLVGVLAPQFIRYVEKSRQSGDVTSIQSIMTAIETSASEEGLITENVTITVNGSTATVAGGTASGATRSISDILAESGLTTTTTLKSSGWQGAVLTYNVSTYKWGITGTTDNSKNPKTTDLTTLVQTTSSGTGTGTGH